MTKILVVDDAKGWRDFNIKIINELLGNEINIDSAESAAEAYDKILENINSPYDVVITDLQMEDDYYPKYAGEWLVEQIKNLSKYYRAKIVMISASDSCRKIAENLGIYCIPKSTALNCVSAYKEVLDIKQ